MPDFPSCFFDIVLVVDESGSMRDYAKGRSGIRKYELVDQILEQFIQKLPSNGRLGVVDFDTQGQLLIGLSNRDTLIKELPRLKSQTGHEGNTSLSAGVAVARQLINGRTSEGSNRPSYVVAITDGIINTGGSSEVDFLVQIGDYHDPIQIKYKYKSTSASDVLGIINNIYEIACPAPKEVQVSFFEDIKPPVPSQGLVEGDIILDGIKIGDGQAVKTLVEGTSHKVEFRKPSHPDYTFTAGVPPSVDFVVPAGGRTIRSVFKPTKVPSAYLTVRTVYDPAIEPDKKGEIYLNGNKPLNIAIPDDPDNSTYLVGTGETVKMRLQPGRYVISFSDIIVPGMTYQTPLPFTIDVVSGDDKEEIRTYSGEYLPEVFWLKPIPDSDHKKIHTRATKGMFSNDVGNMTRFYKTDASTAIDNYYTHIYNEISGSVTASVQFSVAYGHYHGSGSNDEGGQYNDTPTRAIYGQYRNIVMGTARTKFNLVGSETDHVYVITFPRDRRDNKADYAALEINLARLSGSEYIAGAEMSTHTGSNVSLAGTGAVLRLVSDYTINTYPSRSNALIEYNIVSGSIEDGVYSSSRPHKYGKLYPSLGVVLLDARKLDVSASFGTVTTRELDGTNQLKLFTAISGAAMYTDFSGDYLGMKARAAKDEITDHYFINARNKEFNYTNNPSYFDIDTGEVESDFYKNAKTYITTIGLYDIERNLVAVAKTSIPEKKSFTEEVIFNVKLKY